MPLTLVLGPANAAKAGEVLGAFAAAARRDALLVVPTALDAEHYTRELAGAGTLLGTVTTFAGLAREVAGRTGYDAQPISSLARRRLLRRALEQTDLDLLARSAASSGFSEAAARLIGELTRSLITPQRFAQALLQWAREDQRRTAYARELGSIPLAYARELDRLDRVDADLYAWRAVDALRAEPARWGETPVFFYGFDDLSPVECDVVETLARIVRCEVTVALSFEEGRPALSARAEVVEDLRALAGRVLALPPLEDFYAEAARPVLHHLERNLFEPAPQRLEPGDAVALLEAGGELAEAELLASEVLRLLRDGVAAGEIAVVVRSLRRGAPLLRAVFESYGIATAGETATAFTHTALGRATRGLLRCALSADARPEDLLDLLRLPGVAPAERVDLLEAEIRRRGLSTARAAEARWTGGVESIDRLRLAADPAHELAVLVRELLAAGGQGCAPLLNEDGRRDARALSGLIEALSEARELGESLGPAELSALIDELEVPDPAREATPGVLITEPLAIRARRFRAVLVGGLVEGEFPAPALSEPFLTDELRRELALASGLRLPAREDPLPRERYLLYACVSRATERLVLAFRSSDEEGNLQLPSPFAADLAACLAEGWWDRRTRKLLADVVWRPEDAPTERERARSHAAALGLAGPQARGGGDRHLGTGGLAHVRHREMLSAGAIEKYADCPMSWLIERQLSPRGLDPEPEPLARGTLAHTVLELLFDEVDAPLNIERLPGVLQRLDEILDREGAGYARERSEAVRQALRGSLRADLRRYLRAEASDGGSFLPAETELRFGFETDSLPPVVLREGAEPVLLRGTIDRIDVEPGFGHRAIVRDYKSGARRPEQAVARWSEDRRVQVALYMLAVRQLTKFDPVAGLYQPLRGRELRPRGVFLADEDVGTRITRGDRRSREELDEILTNAAALAVTVADGIRAGEVAPRPSTCSREGCRFPGICRP